MEMVVFLVEVRIIGGGFRWRKSSFGGDILNVGVCGIFRRRSLVVVGGVYGRVGVEDF